MQHVAGITEEMLRVIKTAVNGTNSNITINTRQQIADLKRRKAKKKSAFTKSKRAMLIFLDEDLPSRREIKSENRSTDGDVYSSRRSRKCQKEQ